MMAVPVGPRMLVRELIHRAEEQGCKLRFSTAKVATPYGLKTIRYLHNPANNGRFDITDLNDDETVLGSIIEQAARRLGITLP